MPKCPSCGHRWKEEIVEAYSRFVKESDMVNVIVNPDGSTKLSDPGLEIERQETIREMKKNG